MSNAKKTSKIDASMKVLLGTSEPEGKRGEKRETLIQGLLSLEMPM